MMAVLNQLMPDISAFLRAAIDFDGTLNFRLFPFLVHAIPSPVHKRILLRRYSPAL
jgi:hypothetical protein